MVLDDLRWVRSADGLCQQAGCQLGQALDALRLARQAGEMAQRMNVDDVALWCGVGGHAFSARDPGRQRVTVQQWDEDSQEVKPVAVSVCGDHARPVQITTRPKQAITTNGSVTDPAEARARGYDPDYVAWLEQQAAAAFGPGKPVQP